MGRTKNKIFLVTVLAVLMAGCAKQPVNLASSANANATVEAQPAIDEEKARAVSDLIVDDLIHDRRTELRGMMEKGFRDYYDDAAAAKLFDVMFETYGRPLEAEYKMNEAGRKTAAGYDKPLRKFWYAVKTTKYEKGSYFITVEIVPDGDELASSGVAIVGFPLGVPDDLQ